jgi:hypothetical protein
MTLINAARVGDRFEVANSGAVHLADAPASGAQVTMGLRPDALHLSDGDGLAAEFEYAEYLGNEAYGYATLGCGTRVSLRMDPRSPAPEPGARVTLRPDPAAVHFFDPPDRPTPAALMFTNTAKQSEGGSHAKIRHQSRPAAGQCRSRGPRRSPRPDILELASGRSRCL